MPIAGSGIGKRRFKSAVAHQADLQAGLLAERAGLAGVKIHKPRRARLILRRGGPIASGADSWKGGRALRAIQPRFQWAAIATVGGALA